jgi:gas vesicle protein
MNMRTFKIVGLTSVLLMLLAPSFSFAKAKEGTVQLTPKAVELRLALRDLWQGHIFWVRTVVLMTKLGDKEGAKAAEEQVVQNAKDIAGAVVPYYGKEAGDKLFNLLSGHYGAVKDSMNAVYSGNKEAEKVAMDKMTKNAEEIATFLSSANPKNWPKEALVSALAAHGGYHMAQIGQINAKDFSAEAKTWTAMKKQVNEIADVLASGIIKQFPQRFEEGTV